MWSKTRNRRFVLQGNLWIRMWKWCDILTFQDYTKVACTKVAVIFVAFFVVLLAFGCLFLSFQFLAYCYYLLFLSEGTKISVRYCMVRFIAVLMLLIIK